MTSIVDQLRRWTVNNGAKLEALGIKKTAKIPEHGSNIPWKASLGLEYNGVLVSYTVWERTILQTSLLVMNQLKQTVVMEDRTPDGPEAVNYDLEKVIGNLIDGIYKTMKPDVVFVKY